MPPKATAATKKAKRVVVSDSDESSDQASEPECGEQRSFYEILGVEKTANAATIKKAYHKLALLSHPDKNKDDPGATANFQRLQKVMQHQVTVIMPQFPRVKHRYRFTAYSVTSANVKFMIKRDVVKMMSAVLRAWTARSYTITFGTSP